MADLCEKDRDDYRNVLLDCDKASVEEYDKAVMTLSGGAIGVSFAFIKDICDPAAIHCSGLLLTAWGCWGLSITAVLASHYCSHRSMRRALADLSTGKLDSFRPGKCWDDAINILNPAGGILFFVGLISLLFFVSKNVGARGQLHEPTSQTVIVSTTTTTTTSTEPHKIPVSAAITNFTTLQTNAASIANP